VQVGDPPVGGRYSLVESFGIDERFAGGKVQTWRARDTVVERDVILRVITPGGNSAKLFLDRALEMSLIAHPGLGVVYEAVDQGDYGIVVCEWIDGRSLAETLKTGGPMNPTAARKTLGGVAEAITVAHHAGLPIGGITAERVILRDNDAVTLAAVPALFADERGDIQQLGTLLYAALTGEQPDLDDPDVSAHLHRSVPRDLAVLCQRALNPDPARQLGSAAAFAAVLRPRTRPQSPSGKTAGRAGDRLGAGNSSATQPVHDTAPARLPQRNGEGSDRPDRPDRPDATRAIRLPVAVPPPPPPPTAAPVGSAAGGTTAPVKPAASATPTQSAKAAPAPDTAARAATGGAASKAAGAAARPPASVAPPQPASAPAKPGAGSTATTKAAAPAKSVASTTTKPPASPLKSAASDATKTPAASREAPAAPTTSPARAVPAKPDLPAKPDQPAPDQPSKSDSVPSGRPGAESGDPGRGAKARTTTQIPLGGRSPGAEPGASQSIQTTETDAETGGFPINYSVEDYDPWLDDDSGTWGNYDGDDDDGDEDDRNEGSQTRRKVLLYAVPIAALLLVVLLGVFVGQQFSDVVNDTDDQPLIPTTEVTEDAEPPAEGEPTEPEATEGAGDPAPLAPVSAAVFDPFGDGQPENNDQVALSYDGDPASAWPTLTYQNTPEFGNLKPGVGVIFDLGEERSITAIELATNLPGGAVEVRVGAAPDAALDSYPVVGTLDPFADAGTVELAEPVRARFVIIWFIRLVEGNGGFQGALAECRILGT